MSVLKLCPFKDPTDRYPTVDKLCDQDQCMMWRVRKNWRTKPPVTRIFTDGTCTVIPSDGTQEEVLTGYCGLGGLLDLPEEKT